MKKTIAHVMAVVTAAFGLFSVGCGHSHSFENKQEEERFLKSAATCEGPMEYYYSCSCGEVGEESFTVGEKLKHDYSGEVVAEEYLKTAATCQENALYYKSCVNGCGKKSFMTFTVEGLGEHSYTEEVPEGIYVKEDATQTSAAVYHKSCVCGLALDRVGLWEPVRTLRLWKGGNYQNLIRLSKSEKAEAWAGRSRLFEDIYGSLPYPSKITAGRLELDFGKKTDSVRSRVDIQEAVAYVDFDGGGMGIFTSATRFVGVAKVGGRYALNLHISDYIRDEK